MYKLSEKDRIDICNGLDEANSGSWIDLASEVSGSGDEIFIWILIREQGALEAAARTVFDILPPIIERHPGVEFYVSLFEKTRSQKIAWELFENREIVSGVFPKVLGEHPDIKPLEAFDVFGSNNLERD